MISALPTADSRLTEKLQPEAVSGPEATLGAILALQADQTAAIAEFRTHLTQAQAEIRSAKTAQTRIESNQARIRLLLKYLDETLKNPPPPANGRHTPSEEEPSIEAIEVETDPVRAVSKPMVERQERPDGVDTLGLEPDTVAWLRKMSIRRADHLQSLRAETLKEKGKIPPTVLRDIEAKVNLRQD